MVQHCPSCGGKLRIASSKKFGCDDCCVYWSESELAERGSSADEGECQRDKMKGKCSGWESPDERCPLGKHNDPCRCWCSPEDPCPACMPSDWGAVNDELMRRAASPAPPNQEQP